MIKKKLIVIAAIALAGVIAAVSLLMKPEPVTTRAPKKRPAAVSPKKPAPRKAVIAIVIDDLGYSAQNFPILAQIRQPLTLAVLPNLPFSTRACEEMHNRFQIIIHLPMEPKAAAGLEADTILAGMKEEAIKGIIAKALASVPYARGVSNHMGSKVTEDAATLGLIFRELKQRDIFFLDSFVTPESVAAPTAQAAGIRWTRRDVFLDNQLDPAYIRNQLAQLMKKAEKTGRAIAIGHDRTVTLQVLREEMPKMAKKGYTFVFVSELLN